MANTPESVSKLGGKVYNGQSREIISKVMEFMKAEADASKFLIDCRKVRERVQAATGASKSTQIRINEEKRKMTLIGIPLSFETPNKKRKRTKRVTGLGNYDLSVVRRIVNDFYLVEKSIPSIKKIQTKMQTDLNFTGSKTSVRRILKQLGYKSKKMKTNKRAGLLMESHDVMYKRFLFLKEIDQYRAEGRPIIYNNESYIESSHGCKTNSNAGNVEPINKGSCLIMLHAGGEMGFIDGCLTMWQAHHKTGDYNDNNINHNMYIKWLNEKLIPNLPARSVIVIGNAACYNVQLDKCPTSNSTKADMQAWLSSQNIPFSENMIKIELYELIKRFKPSNRKYVVDDMLQQHGHNVLRLPPYHPELNAIELVWADVKNGVAAKNVTFKIADVENLVREIIKNISVEDWKKKCEDVKKHEKELLEIQERLDNSLESLAINVGTESSDDEDISSYSESEKSDDEQYRP